jgi:hypothetical protein
MIRGYKDKISKRRVLLRGMHECKSLAGLQIKEIDKVGAAASHLVD